METTTVEPGDLNVENVYNKWVSNQFSLNMTSINEK